MNHYPHHIGDFDKATRHLTRIERSVYRDLIELYYDTETQLPLDLGWICRKIIARSDEESTAVEQTLNEFFTKTATGWYHSRCELEIEAYRTNMSQKALAGRASATSRALKKQQALNARSTAVGSPVATAVERTSNGTPTNQEPGTRNHEPGTSMETGGEPSAPDPDPDPAAITGPTPAPIRKPRARRDAPELVTAEALVAEGVGLQHAEDWLLIRKGKNLPLTRTAWDGIKTQAKGVGITPAAAVQLSAEQGWAGFKSTWYQNHLNEGQAAHQGSRGSAPPINRQEALEQRNAAVGRAWAAKQTTT